MVVVEVELLVVVVAVEVAVGIFAIFEAEVGVEEVCAEGHSSHP